MFMMNKNIDLLNAVRDAGIIGAGGAGFPTHVKINCKAEYVIANGAECEPLLRVDQQVMALYAEEIVEAMLAVKAHVGARWAVVVTKAHYHDAVKALEAAMAGKEGISLKLLDSYYPAGDEQQMVYEVTGRVVPTGGLPLDVGAVVCNVSTLLNIYEAADGKPVIDKFVTVGGAVRKPSTFKTPVGTPISALIEAAGGAIPAEYTVIIGGPCMGKLTDDITIPVTKTTGGILVIPKGHALIKKKTNDPERDIKLARAVCCQCSQCTQLCPRNALGLKVEPHKAMRAVAYGDGSLISDFNGVFSCCDCGICSYYACNFDLSPSRMMQRLKGALAKNGAKPVKQVAGEVDPARDLKRVPISRMIAKLGITEYDVPAPMAGEVVTDTVKIPLKMHIGAPAVSVVEKGAAVKAGDLIADIKEGALGAKVHASIDGIVTEVTGEAITISKR